MSSWLTCSQVAEGLQITTVLDRRSLKPSSQSSNKRPRELVEQTGRSLSIRERHRPSTEEFGHRHQRQSPELPERQPRERDQVESPPRRRLKIREAAQRALASPLSEGQVAGSPLVSPARRRPFLSPHAQRPRASQPPISRSTVYGAAQGFHPPESHPEFYAEPLLDTRLPSHSGPQQTVGAQGMDALQDLPGPALNALLNIVDQSPALMYVPSTIWSSFWLFLACASECLLACMPTCLPFSSLARMRPPKPAVHRLLSLIDLIHIV